MERGIVIEASIDKSLTTKEAKLARQLYSKYKDILNLLDDAPDKLMDSSTIYEDIMDEVKYLKNLI